MAREQRDWNQDYAEGHTPWDKGMPSPALLEVIDKNGFNPATELLVPGCGYGHDVAALAQAGFLATGMDLSALALAEARSFNGVEGADYVLGDFFDPGPEGSKRYDAIWEHTCFCAIRPEQRGCYVEAAHHWLKPGGVLIGVFFAFADDPDREGPPFKTNIETIEEHFKERFILDWGRLPRACYPGREGEEWLMSWRRV